jgi:nucleotide-binding universal stress UspA family protein
MPINAILVATDFSAQEHMALRRAWRLADAHRATVTLMYLPAAGQPVPANAAVRLADAARQLEEVLELRVRTVPVTAHKLEDLVAQAQGQDLVILPHRTERSTAAFFRGQPVLRVLRQANCPVLVARQPGDVHYRRILVPVDFSSASQDLVKLAARFDDRAELELFHAVSTLDEARLRSAEATEQAVRIFRENRREQAQARLLALTHVVDARRQRVRTVVGRGDAGMQAVMQQDRTGADLVVVGKRRSSAWEDFFRGSVAHRVLSWGSSDVLLVPERAEHLAARTLESPRKRHTRRSLAMQPAGRRAS